LLGDADTIFKSLHRLRHSGHDVILFHILDEAEVHFPFHGKVELIEPESQTKLPGNADALRADYMRALDEFKERFRRDCAQSRIDYVELDTSIPFDKALIGYLMNRRPRR
jgi:uncharacterized protein (DUF58 family)